MVVGGFTWYNLVAQMLEERPQAFFLVPFSFDNQTVLGPRQSFSFATFSLKLYDITQFDELMIKSRNFISLESLRADQIKELMCTAGICGYTTTTREIFFMSIVDLKTSPEI